MNSWNNLAEQAEQVFDPSFKHAARLSKAANVLTNLANGLQIDENSSFYIPEDGDFAVMGVIVSHEQLLNGAHAHMQSRLLGRLSMTRYGKKYLAGFSLSQTGEVGLNETIVALHESLHVVQAIEGHQSSYKMGEVIRRKKDITEFGEAELEAAIVCGELIGRNIPGMEEVIKSARDEHVDLWPSIGVGRLYPTNETLQ